MKNLEQRNGLWYAVLVIPEPLREAFGRYKFIQSLKTPSKADAEFRAGPVLTEWRAQIRKARGQDFDPRASEADRWRQSLREAHDHEEQGAIEDLIEHRAKEIAKSKGIEAGSNFYQHAMGLTTPLAPLAKEWEAQLDVAAKTKDQMSRDVAKLVTHFSNVQRITPKAAKVWVDALTKDGATHSSLKRILGSGRSFWKYLRRTSVIELDAPDPLAGMIDLTSAKVRKNKQSWLPFSSDEVVRLYEAATAKGDGPLVDLIAFGAYTGARIEELCSLKTEHVLKDHIEIRDAKTDAGDRDVPIHPAIRRLVARLVKDSADGYLIPSTAGSKYGVRSDPLSKRFGRLKTSLGFGRLHVFHSIRKTLATLMEQAGVSEGVTADVIGHEKPTMTYGVYSGGTSMKQRVEAISKASYPAPLDKP